MVNHDTLDKKSKVKVFFLIIVVLISLFVSNRDINYLLFFNLSSVHLYIPLFMLFILYALAHKTIYIDIVTMILLARVVIYIIPITYSSHMEGYWGNYFSVIASFVSYFVASQSHNNTDFFITKKISRVFVVFTTLIAIQVIYIYFSLFLEHGMLNINLLKFNMVTPVGASNYVAAVISPLLIFVYYSNFKNGTKFLVIFLGIISLFMIQSKNALFVLILLISVKVIIGYFKKINSLKVSASLRMPLIIITIFLTLIIAFGIYNILRYFIISWNMGMTLGTGSLYDTINALTSNRLTVYSTELARWTEHILLGNGLSYQLGYARSHNWIIELLAQSGIVGFTLFVTAIIWWFFRVYNYKMNNSFIRAAYMSVIVILIQGLAEITLFTNTIDILFWYLIGTSIAEVNFIKKERRRLEVKNCNGN